MKRAGGVEPRRVGLPEEPAERVQHLAVVELAFPDTRNAWYANVFEVQQREAAAMDACVGQLAPRRADPSGT